MTDSELIKISQKAQYNAYAVYSGFKVGAALLCQDGKVFTGCNIENSSYGAANCAERTAVFKAVSEGYKKFKAIAITSSEGKLTFPCGICRQVLMEFSPEMKVILCENDRNPISYKLNELLPYAFKL